VTITTRTATGDDLPALLSLYAELHPGDPRLTDEVAHEVWRRISTQAGRTILVAEDGAAGAVVGTVDCTVLPNLTRGARPFMLVENVVVAEAARRRGVGSALFDAVLALAEGNGCYKIQLLSRATRDEAHEFYEAQGFAPVAQGFRRYLR
jgi:ribosomal protein S18 acetylase RimI-like enzyme